MSRALWLRSCKFCSNFDRYVGMTGRFGDKNNLVLVTVMNPVLLSTSIRVLHTRAGCEDLTPCTILNLTTLLAIIDC